MAVRSLLLLLTVCEPQFTTTNSTFCIKFRYIDHDCFVSFAVLFCFYKTIPRMVIKGVTRFFVYLSYDFRFSRNSLGFDCQYLLLFSFRRISIPLLRSWLNCLRILLTFMHHLRLYGRITRQDEDK